LSLTRKMTPDEARLAIEQWSQILSMGQGPGWQHVVRAIENDRKSALDVLSSTKVKDPFDIGRARGVLEEAAQILHLVARAQTEIDELSKLEE
jgi:hypothetical protein